MIESICFMYIFDSFRLLSLLHACTKITKVKSILLQLPKCQLESSINACAQQRLQTTNPLI